MSKVIRLTLSLNDTDKVFKEGFGPGEILHRELAFPDDKLSEKQMKSPMFLKYLMDVQEEMIEEHFKWKIERMDDE